jgi:hypothetical protein
MQTRFPAVFVATALVAAQALAVYPPAQPDAAGFWLIADLALLVLAARGRRWALGLLAASTAFGALLFITAGLLQVTSQPRYLLRGIAFAIAAFPLLRVRRAVV